MLTDLTGISHGTLLRAVSLWFGVPDLVTNIFELLILHQSITIFLDLLDLGWSIQIRQALESNLLALEPSDDGLGTLFEEEDGPAFFLE